MIRHYCDSCGIRITPETGIISEKELTIELGDRKISIAIDINIWRHKGKEDTGGDLCSTCLAKRLLDWSAQINRTKGTPDEVD